MTAVGASDAATEVDEQEDVEDAATAGSSAPAGRGRRWAVRVLVVLVVLAMLVAVVLAALSLRSASTRDAERDELLGTARQAAVAFTSYDHADIDAGFQAVLALATEEFREQFRAASDQLRPVIAQKQATARGEVLAAAVERYDPDEKEASVLVAVDSTVTNTDVPDGAVQRFRLRLRLERAGDQWRVDEITPVV